MNTILGFLADWKVKLAIITFVLIAAFSYHKVQIKIQVNKAVAEAVADIREQTAKENARLADSSLQAKIELQDKANKIQKDKDNEIADLKSRVRTLSDSLSKRPNRPIESGVPNNPSTQESPGYVAADRLYRDDAAVAIWFATRTEGLKIELQTCYKQYDEAKSILDKFKKDSTPEAR